MVRDIRSIKDDTKRGIAKLRERQAQRVLDRDQTRLTDIKGIGKSTAENLREAGVDKPEELARMTPYELNQVPGIGPAKADEISDDFQYGQDVRSGSKLGDVSDSKVERARDVFARAGADDRRTDRSYNAPTTTDFEKWRNNIDEYDFPGVDTIPEQRRAERVGEKAERLGVEVEVEKIRGRTAGKHSRGTATVDPGGFDPVSTLAHEVGHAADDARNDRLSKELLDDEETRDEAEEIARRRRFSFDSRDDLKQDKSSELFADTFAVATEEPRRTKKEHPGLFRDLQDAVLEDIGRF